MTTKTTVIVNQTVKNTCGRCRGRGNTGHFWRDGGQCYGCGGKGFRYETVQVAVERPVTQPAAPKVGVLTEEEFYRRWPEKASAAVRARLPHLFVEPEEFGALVEAAEQVAQEAERGECCPECFSRQLIASLKQDARGARRASLVCENGHHVRRITLAQYMEAVPF